LRLFFVFFEQERKAEAAFLYLGDGHVTGSFPALRPGSLPVSIEAPSCRRRGGSPTSGPGSPPVTMGAPSLPSPGDSSTSGGTDWDTSEAAVEAA
jgi:hypothetical protein